MQQQCILGLPLPVLRSLSLPAWLVWGTSPFIERKGLVPQTNEILDSTCQMFQSGKVTEPHKYGFSIRYTLYSNIGAIYMFMVVISILGLCYF